MGSSMFKIPTLNTLMLLLLICANICILSAEQASCDFEYLENQVLDLSGISDEGKAVILAEQAALDMKDCSELCCAIYEESYTNEKTCNTAVYLPTLERPENCFLVHCDNVYCGQDYLLITNAEEHSNVIFLKRFHDAEGVLMSTTAETVFSYSTTTTGVQEPTTEEHIQSRDPISTVRGTSTEEPSDHCNDTDTIVDHEESIDIGSDSHTSPSNTQEVSMESPEADFGAIILATFACLSIAAATVLIANKCYQMHEKQKLYDRLDYLSAEPLYSSSTVKD